MSDAVKYHEGWKIVHAAWGALGEAVSGLNLAVSGIVGAAAVPFIYLSDITINRTKNKRKKAQRELHTGSVDEDLLREAQEDLRQLEALAR